MKKEEDRRDLWMYLIEQIVIWYGWCRRKKFREISLKKFEDPSKKKNEDW
jgi:hypothetical protein